MRSQGRENGLDARDRRELESLVRDERTLTRRQRLAEEEIGADQHWSVRAWHKTAAVLRPLKLIGGLLLIVVALVIWTSMLITAIDKIKNSVCGSRCGYLLAHTNIIQPVNWLMVRTSRIFPVDYVIFLVVILIFFAASVVGIATVGIRFLWVNLFRIRKGHTSPQALLMATVFLTLITFAINYATVMLLAPQYATYGAQTYCDRLPHYPDEQPDCSNHRKAVRSCRENPGRDSEDGSPAVANRICTPTVVSTFLNRITVNFPFFGLVTFWAQFAFLAFFILVFVVMIFRTPRLDEEQLDDDLREEEEEGLLASTSRRFGATWQDITGRATGVRRQPQLYGTNDEEVAG